MRTADEVAPKRECSRSALVAHALRWYLRVQDLPWEEATPEELEAIERRRAEHARGEFATLDEIRRELAADLVAQPRRNLRRLPPEARRDDMSVDHVLRLIQIVVDVLWFIRDHLDHRNPLKGERTEGGEPDRKLALPVIEWPSQ